MKQLLLNERWRPKLLDEMVLLPRIKKYFSEGLKQNVILYGHYGTGKTTLARIIIGKWSKNTPFLEINSSFYTSIETLRTKIDDFCSNVYMSLDTFEPPSSDQIKYVFLDEFERTSLQYQDALKAYIEEYSNKKVRFILNTNHLDKISEGIKSRMTCINFDPQDVNEEKFLKQGMFLKIMNEICPVEKISIPRDKLIQIIKSSFPDFRKTLNSIQTFSITGSLDTFRVVNEEIKISLYHLLSDKETDYEKTFHFVNDNFGPENISQLIKLLGSDFSSWSLESDKKWLPYLFEVNELVSNANSQLATSIDPLVVGLALIGRIKKLGITQN